MGDDIATLVKLVKEMRVEQTAMAQQIAVLTAERASRSKTPSKKATSSYVPPSWASTQGIYLAPAMTDGKLLVRHIVVTANDEFNEVHAVWNGSVFTADYDDGSAIVYETLRDFAVNHKERPSTRFRGTKANIKDTDGWEEVQYQWAPNKWRAVSHLRPASALPDSKPRSVSRAKTPAKSPAAATGSAPVNAPTELKVCPIDNDFQCECPTTRLDPLSNRSPMLAETYDKHKGAIVFPAYIQPKLDGCRAVYADGKFVSRTGKPQKGGSVILKELATLDLKGMVLDGEFYIHKESFQSVMKSVHADDAELEYHVFDIISKGTFFERIHALKSVLRPLPHVHLVATSIVMDSGGIDEAHTDAQSDFYEGIMVRNKNSLYANRRSKDLLKVKMFHDAEFEVVDYSKDENGCVLWECKTDAGKTFRVKPTGSLDSNRDALKTAATFVGRMYTVKFQELTDDGIPRFPTGLHFRSDDV
jgi:hypothetical protein